MKDLNELIGDTSPEERPRLQRAHDLLLQAGPPPELPPALAEAPVPAAEPRLRDEYSWLPRRRSGRMLTLAIGFAAVALGIGYVIGRHQGGFTNQLSVPMHGTSAAPHAFGVVNVAPRDANGNFPLEVKVGGLRHLPPRSFYVLYLVKNGKTAAICGSFVVRRGQTTVRMSAPYDFREYDGWTVAVYTFGHKKPGPTLLASKGAV